MPSLASETWRDRNSCCLLMIFIGVGVADPVRAPPGPMEVLNMRLKSIGAEREFPVTGDLMENLANMAASSSWL